MNELIYKEIANKIATLPLRAASFYSKTEYGDPYDANVIFYHLESESSFRISPITRNTDTGTIRRLGYRLEANLYIPHNILLKTSIPFIFEELFKERYTFTLYFGSAIPWSEAAHNPPEVKNASDSMKISISAENFTHIIEIETVLYRPRVIVRLSGFDKYISSITIS